MRERLIELIKLGDQEALTDLISLMTRNHEITELEGIIELNNLILSVINPKTDKISSEILKYREEMQEYIDIFEKYLITSFPILTLPILVQNIREAKLFSFYSYYQAPTIEYKESIHKESVDIINSTISMRLESVELYKGLLGKIQWVFNMLPLFDNKMKRPLNKEDYAKYVFNTYGINLKFPNLLEYRVDE